jgi:dipeptidase E
MKLFLASLGITDKLAPYFRDLLVENRSSGSVPRGYIIENASDYKGKDEQLKLRQYYTILRDYGIDYEFLDLKNFENKTNKLDSVLGKADFVYVAGGNIFYLYYWMVKSGLDKIIKSQIDRGLVYAGASAGSIIVGPTIKYLDKVDDISISPDPDNTKWEGMKIIDFVILPHWGEDKYQAASNEIKVNLENDGYKVKTLTNKQALVVIDEETKLVEERD